MDIVECIPAHLPLLHPHTHTCTYSLPGDGWHTASCKVLRVIRQGGISAKSPGLPRSGKHTFCFCSSCASRSSVGVSLLLLRTAHISILAKNVSCGWIFCLWSLSSDESRVFVMLLQLAGLSWKESKCCNYFQRISLQTGLSRSKQYEIFPWLRYNLFVANILRWLFSVCRVLFSDPL